ncbi:MAG: DUF2075 domain-containing protein [Coriobacteriia bacterium]|nr:DUF2075 domain-containing protein [Coriobacteriia bacterium]
MLRAWYKNSCDGFLVDNPETIVGALAAGSARDGFDATPQQIKAWLEEIYILKTQLKALDASNMDIFLEFNIPRMGKRIDALLFIKSDKPHLVILEFKVGMGKIQGQDIDQVMDYALELKNFHRGSHGADIFPVLILTELNASISNEHSLSMAAGLRGIARPICVGAYSLCTLIEMINYTKADTLSDQWEMTPYQPTPTIIEAARALYANHDVRDITRSEGSAASITETSEKLLSIITNAKERNRKTIAFVTGVPGAGKTLVGLNMATIKRDERDDAHAVFLSGNGPLVEVLQEALTRDEQERNGGTKYAARTKVKSFIQIVHHFRDEGIRDPGPPFEHVAIFDEAQRAWDKEMTVDFMRRKKGVSGFDMSEPEFLISCLDRHKTWAVIICLVGGGQEINRGEAGIGAWIEAVLDRFPSWDIAISDKLVDTEYAAGQAVELAASRSTGEGCGSTYIFSELHLSVSMRSFRAENVSSFVKALLDLDTEKARTELQALEGKYPIRITRNLSLAKQWIRQQVQGSERPGLLASSKALRLKPFAIDVKGDTNPVHYFLGGKDDPRSSYYLEAAGSEFDVQGLELDYALVSWDGDLRMGRRSGSFSSEWLYHDFRGHRWMSVNNQQSKRYLKNAYRVLLTRARQGMVIFVPLGNNPPDATRDASYYDGTYHYLKSLGIPELVSEFEDRGY